jgi:hypothetical protein
VEDSDSTKHCFVPLKVTGKSPRNFRPSGILGRIPETEGISVLRSIRKSDRKDNRKMVPAVFKRGSRTRACQLTWCSIPHRGPLSALSTPTAATRRLPGKGVSEPVTAGVVVDHPLAGITVRVGVQGSAGCPDLRVGRRSRAASGSGYFSSVLRFIEASVENRGRIKRVSASSAMEKRVVPQLM